MPPRGDIEEQVSGTTQVRYVWSLIDQNALVIRDSNPSGGVLTVRLWVQQDVNCNVTSLVNTYGTVVERYVYDPYGAVTYLTGTWGSRSSSSYAWQYLFQAGRLDGVSGLYVFEHRDYSVALGRWLGNDPLAFGGGDHDLYRFVEDSPCDGIDPSGLESPAPAAVRALLESTPTGTGALNTVIKEPRIHLWLVDWIGVTGRKKNSDYGLTEPGDDRVVNVYLSRYKNRTTRDMAATFIHEVEHAQAHFTHKGGGEVDSRKRDLQFFIELLELQKIKLADVYEPNQALIEKDEMGHWIISQQKLANRYSGTRIGGPSEEPHGQQQRIHIYPKLNIGTSPVARPLRGSDYNPPF